MFPSTADTSVTPSQAFYGLDQIAVIRTAIIAAFCVLAALAYMRNVNWDEFFYLSQVHAHLDGRLDRPLQTIHVHLFGWLALLPGNEMTQIFAARLVMTLCLAVSAGAIWHIARHVAGRGGNGTLAAGAAVLAFLSSGYALGHGASFRTDPIASALLMVALAIVVTARMTAVQIVLLALCGALALLVTIKSALYLPALLGGVFWRLGERGMILRFLAAAILALVFAGGLYLWHSAGILQVPGRDAASTTQGALRTTLMEAGIAPRRSEALLWALLSLVPLALVAIGIVRAPDARLRIVLVLFALPLVLSVLFYRNAFAYFFPFIVPPLMVAAALGVSVAKSRGRLNTLIALMLLSGGWQAMMSLSEDARLQRETIAEVHRLFPEPVAYIDQNAMISSFPRDTFFMSSWGMARYRATGEPVMADLIARTAPPMLLASRQHLHRVMTDPVIADIPNLLMPADIAILRDTYVHYSGAIWLAGKEVELGDAPSTLVMPIPGRYRLESPVAVAVNGAPLVDGQVVDIDGRVSVSGPAGTTVRLIWDTAVASPSRPAPWEEHYAGFWLLAF